MEKVSKESFVVNTIWKFTDVVVRKMVGMVISIILARLVAPEAYGVIALTTVFITFTDIFILNGFNVALIRKNEVEEIDYSTVTSMSLMFTSLMYIIFFFTAPIFADFYDSPELCDVLRVITILLFFQSIATVVRAKGTRELKFKKMAVSAFVSNFSAGLIAVFFAYHGWGVWALVAQQLIANFLDMAIMMMMFRWRLSFRLSLERAGNMFKFTMGVLGSSFLDFLGNNVCNLVIGKSYSTKMLGYLNRGNMLPEVIGLNIYSAITSVLLPTLASYQDDTKKMKEICRRVMSLTLFVIFPLMFGLIGIADVLIPVLLTEKWIPCIPMLYFCAISYAFNPIRAIGYSVFYAKGQSKYSVKLEIVRATLLISGLIIVICILKGSLIDVLLSNTIVCFVVSATAQHLVRKCIGYGFREIFRDILPSLLLSLLMMIIVFLIGRIEINPILLLIIQIIVGGLFYVGMAAIIKDKNLMALSDYMTQKINRHGFNKCNDNN